MELTGEWSLSQQGCYLVYLTIVENDLANDLAKRFSGAHIGLEHRYYGEGTSQPTSDFSTENLKWLTADQGKLPSNCSNCRRC